MLKKIQGFYLRFTDWLGDKLAHFLSTMECCFATKNTLNLVQLKGGKEKKSIYNIQRINAYHGELKLFLRPFKGVSTKCLNNYLIWHNFVNYANETTNEKQNILLNFALTTPCLDECRIMSYRKPIPLAT